MLYSYSFRPGYSSTVLYILPAHPATIHNQDVAAHVATGLARQIHRRTLEVLRGTPVSGRNARGDASQALRVRQQSLVHVCGDVAGGDGVDRDALGRPLVGEALCDLAHGALGRGVGRDGEAALEGEQRGKVDDAAAAAGNGGGLELEHVGADVAAEGEDGVEVYLDDLGVSEYCLDRQWSCLNSPR